METVEEAIVPNPPDEGVKTNITEESLEIKRDSEVCQKSNGLADASETSQSNVINTIVDTLVPETKNALASGIKTAESETSASKPNEYLESCSSNLDKQNISSNDSALVQEQHKGKAPSSETLETDVIVNSKLSDLQQPPESSITAVNDLLSDIQNEQTGTNENVKFETEILVETNDNDVNELDLNSTNDEVSSQETASNILSELGQNIELNEVLRSSDNAENGENNNHSMGQEVFNKEELLDILEGNDVSTSDADGVGYEVEIEIEKSEAQLALEQLSRLKNTRNRKSRSSDIVSRRRNTNVAKLDSNSAAIESKKDDILKSKKDDNVLKSKKEDSVAKSKKCDREKPKKEDSIVNKLVEDWDDDEPVEEQTDPPEEKSNSSVVTSTEQHVEVQETIVGQDVTARTSIDSSTSDGTTPNKGNDDGQPQRRLGRVIKKKVIYDPDNPDTFTKCKTKKEPTDEPPLKKGKIEPTVHRPKSKSPVSKLQWKKPQPKNSKQNKRLSEVDKLLMDEGAVNMIYQLTPEAPKGRKNMRTKAEFIKKIQSSTPETKEMKFRERKIKLEEGEAKKIIGHKQRSSLSSSVKSPSVCEDFETHSADDSIIYRRHSSSSYSSSCMSPRRLSDVDGGLNQSSQMKLVPKEMVIKETENAHSDISGDLSSDIFINKTEDISSEIINKSDCLSIKEKLNSKLSLALNKRKRENSKNDKLVKQKKISKGDRKVKDDDNKYTNLSVTYDQQVAEILIRKTGSKYTNVLFKELCQALEEVDARKDISVTLLMSECGALCSNLDLSSLISDDIEERTNSAYDFAEDIRLVLFAMVQHSKLLCTGVWGACSGVALGLVALCDVKLASETATFALAAADSELVQPGIMLLSSPLQSLSQSLVNDLVIFGCSLTASEAHRGGLVSRVLLPAGHAPVRQVVRDIANKRQENILLKKRLLNLKNVSNNAFLSCLIKERDLIVNYWTSNEGQELLRTTITA